MDENRTMNENKTGEDVQKLQNEAPQSVQLSAPYQFMDLTTRPGKTRLTECIPYSSEQVCTNNPSQKSVVLESPFKPNLVC